MQKERSGVLNFDETCQLWDELLFWRVRLQLVVQFSFNCLHASFRAIVSNVMSCQVCLRVSHCVCIAVSVTAFLVSILQPSAMFYLFPTVSFHLNLDRSYTCFSLRPCLRLSRLHCISFFSPDQTEPLQPPSPMLMVPVTAPTKDRFD